MVHPVGIIGLGMIGGSMLEEFLTHPSFSVPICWDLNPEICRRIKEKHPSVPIASSAEQVLQHSNIEMVYIATPPVTHVAYGLSIIDLGKALFMEKPLAISLEEGRKLVESAEHNSIKTAINFGYGAGPVVEALENALTQQEIGKITSIEVRYEYPSWPLPNQLSAASWITNRHTGGMVREMFSHQVYLMLRLFGPLSVNWAKITYPAEPDAAETFIQASLQTGDIEIRFMGGIGSLETPRYSNFTINGTHGSLRLDENAGLVYAKNGSWQPYPSNSTRTAAQARLDQIANLLEGKPSTIPGLRDGYETQKVIENLIAYQS